MLLPAFKLHTPDTVDEAVALAQRYNGDCDFLAGGTDLLPNYKENLNHRAHVIALNQIEALGEISAERIGSAARLVDVERDPAIGKHYPAVVETIGQIASPLLRESGTVGGNLMVDTRCHFFNQGEFWRGARGNCFKTLDAECHVIPSEDRCFAAYSGDLAPVLMVLGCSFGIAGATGTREVKADAFFVEEGIERNHLEPGEVLTHVTFPAEARAIRAGYQKLRFRSTLDFPAAGVAAGLQLDESGKVMYLRVVANAVASAPLAMDALTAPLMGSKLTASAIEALAERVMDEITPMKISVVSTVYRRKMIGVFIRRLLTRLSAGA